MEAKQLGNILRDMYNNAPRHEQVTMIHLFGIKYGEEIKKYGIKEIVIQSGIHSTYVTEVSKGINLAKYVRPISEKKSTPSKNLSKKYAGRLPAESAKKLQEHIKQSRAEWDI